MINSIIWLFLLSAVCSAVAPWGAFFTKLKYAKYFFAVSHTTFVITLTYLLHVFTSWTENLFRVIFNGG